MINWSDVNSLQKEKSDKEIKLNELLKSKEVSIDEINELRSEILYLKKQIEKIVGSNEIKRQRELRIKKSGVEQKKLNDYCNFKIKYKKICRMNSSIRRIVQVVDKYNKNLDLNKENEIIRMKM